MGERKVEQAVLQNLEDAGCSGDVVNRYCELESQTCSRQMIRKDQIRLLCQQRKELLEELHRCQQKLDCLDYLLYQMKEQQRNDEA